MDVIALDQAGIGEVVAPHEVHQTEVPSERVGTVLGHEQPGLLAVDAAEAQGIETELGEPLLGRAAHHVRAADDDGVLDAEALERVLGHRGRRGRQA